MTRWTDAKAYRPDLYASLAAVTLPDSGSISQSAQSAWQAPFRGTVARKATDLSWAMPSARAADASHSSLLRVSTIGGIAIAAFALLYFIAELARAL